MKSNKFKILIFILALPFVISCGNKTRVKVDLNERLGSLEVVEGVGFDQIFNEILAPKCLQCHSNYNDYDLVARQGERFLDAIVTGRMPKGGAPLSDELQGLFNSWVMAGSPLEAGGGVVEEIPLAANFTSIFANIIAPKCLACHTGSTISPAPPEINFSDYAAIIESNNGYAEIFGEGFLDQDLGADSEIIFLVTDTASPMPPLSIPGNTEYNENPLPQLNSAEVSVLTKWIENGFPND